MELTPDEIEGFGRDVTVSPKAIQYPDGTVVEVKGGYVRDEFGMAVRNPNDLPAQTLGLVLKHARDIIDGSNDARRERSYREMSLTQANRIGVWAWGVYLPNAKAAFRAGRYSTCRMLMIERPPMSWVAERVGDTVSHVARDIRQGFSRYGFYTLSDGRDALANGLWMMADAGERRKEANLSAWIRKRNGGVVIWDTGDERDR